MKFNLDKRKLPKIINPCPITEGIIELRFESKIPYDAIFGIIYNEFKNEYPILEELPILQLPEAVRKNDPNLQNKPYYKLLSENKKFIFNIGARVYSLINIEPYIGWSKFSKKVKDTIERIKKLSIVDVYTRIGIRYINGFDYNIFEKIDLSVIFNDFSLKDFNSLIRIDFPSNEFISTLQVSNNAQIKRNDTISKGSILDIDTHIKNPGEDIIKLVEKGHLEEKKLFFNLLKEDFINKDLRAEY